ncbi:hypothetical protein M1O29_03365 [Dehalococcoidia bacterium]|nr:hypothetical protein [Dehalococcoidia bacterium]
MPRSQNITILHPRGEPIGDDVSIVARLDTLAGKKVALLTEAFWPSWGVFTDEITDTLGNMETGIHLERIATETAGSRGGGGNAVQSDAAVEESRKQLLADLVTKVDAAVVGLGA